MSDLASEPAAESSVSLPLAEIGLQSDAELMQLIAMKNEPAFDELIRRYATQVHCVCRRICFEETEASSLVYEVFWELWRRASRFNQARGSVRTFLLLMARTRSIDRRRSQVVRQRAQDQFAQFAMHNGVDRSYREFVSDVTETERGFEVRQALSGLPENQRKAIELAFLDGFTHEQVSEEVGAPLGTVKTRIRLGLIRLRSVMAKNQLLEDQS